MNVVRLWPGWGPRDILGPLPVSDALRLRVRTWNRTWQSVLDPVREIRWPDAEVGRQWIAEGHILVRDLPAELGPGLQVVEGFLPYDPDAVETPGQ